MTRNSCHQTLRYVLCMDLDGWNVRDSYCTECQRASVAVQRLPGTRLGSLERALLQEAAPPGGARAMLPYGPGVTGQTAVRRAASKLIAAGLLNRNRNTLEARDIVHVKKLHMLARHVGVIDSTEDDLLRFGYATIRSLPGGRMYKSKVRIGLVSRTYLGDEIASEFSRELASGSRIRWDPDRVQGALDRASARCPHLRSSPR